MNNENTPEENQDDITAFFGEPIHCYTRAQALADGMLIDVSATANEAGYKYPFAVTRALWEVIQNIPAHTDWQDTDGRLWDCLSMGIHAIRNSTGDGSRVAYTMLLSTPKAESVELVLVIGPGDTAAPVFTLGFAGDF